MKNIYIDANPTLLFKNSFIVSQFIEHGVAGVKSIFVSFESAYEDQNVSNSSIKALLANINNMFVRFPSYNPKIIEQYLMREKPSNVVLCGYRIPDIVWLAVCNKIGLNTVYYQHGFDINHVKRRIGSLFNEYMKVIKYSIAVFRLSLYMGVNPIIFFADYLKFVVFGSSFKHTLFEDTRLWPNKFFVYSDYYINFWKNKIGIFEDRIEVMGATDLMKVDEIRSNCYENSVCYLAQTFVEDGRISKSQYYQIIDQYRVLALSVEKLFIKLHPRSDISLYSVFDEMENVELVRDNFPFSSIYISHYSSTIFLASHLSKNVIIHDLPEDPSLEIFKEVASFVSSDINKIIAYSNEHINDKPEEKIYHNEKLNFIAPIPAIHPLKIVSNCISKSD